MNLPKIVPRQPLPSMLPNTEPTGYMESDRDYVMSNVEAAVSLLDRELGKQRKGRT